jgi:hypothetical protein
MRPCPAVALDRLAQVGKNVKAGMLEEIGQQHMVVALISGDTDGA